jgi:phosphatidylethanolamine N-methyltransferase
MEDVILGITETETEVETEETETEEIFNHVRVTQVEPIQTPTGSDSRRSTSSNASSTSLNGDTSGKKKSLSQHDLFNKYFRRDTVVLKNLDLLRFVL